MNGREQFLEALRKNEDDTPVRLAFADWLDEQGEHEEADRQRKWPPSKAWIIGFCADHQDNFPEPLTYSIAMEIGLKAAASIDKDSRMSVYCGRDSFQDPDLWQEFFKHWSIVSGIELSSEAIKNMRYYCAC